MKLIYIANIRLPTEKAHGIQIMKMCEAFSSLGKDVTLVVPIRLNAIKENPFKYYDVKQNFNIIHVPSIDLVRFGSVGFWIQSLSFLLSTFFYAVFKRDVVFYTRDELIAGIFPIFGKKVVWETHTRKNNLITSRALRCVHSIVALTQASKDYYVHEFKTSQEKILVAPDAVDIDSFSFKQTKKEIRLELGLPIDNKIVGYIGKYKTMGESKGVDEIIEAFARVEKDAPDALVMVAGLNEEEISQVENICDKNNVSREKRILIPHIKFSLIPKYLKAYDVLVMNYPNTDHYARFMSPLKLFEYMASSVPIITTDLPSIREILNEQNALIIKENDSRGLSNGLLYLLKNDSFSASIAEQAYKDVHQYTWRKRAATVLSLMKIL